MIVDTSALVAILFGDEEAEPFARIILDADICRLSIANYLELTIVTETQLGAEGTRHAEMFIGKAGIAIEPITIQQGALARQAFLDFGKGRHKADLNFGDCFAYALARTMNEPLLFKGDNFLHTDIEPAPGTVPPMPEPQS